MPLADNHILLVTFYDDLHCLEYNFNNTVAEISMQINTENTQIMGSRGMKSIPRKICNNDGILE
jgi:hypothetical protein